LWGISGGFLDLVAAASGVLNRIKRHAGCRDRLAPRLGAVKDSSRMKGGVSYQLFRIFSANTMGNQRHGRTQSRQYFIDQ